MDLLKEAWRNLASHRARTFLSGLGILFGVAAVIGILSIGEGARREQEALIAELGILNLVVRSAELPEDEEARQEILRRSPGLSERDVRDLSAVLPGLTHAGGLRVVDPGQVFPRPTDSSPLRFVGVEPGYLAGNPGDLVRGRPLTDDDELGRQRVCLLGERAAAALFGGQDPIGQHLRLDRTVLTVVGVVSSGGGGETSLEGVAILPGTEQDTNISAVRRLSDYPRMLSHGLAVFPTANPGFSLNFDGQYDFTSYKDEDHVRLVFGGSGEFVAGPVPIRLGGFWDGRGKDPGDDRGYVTGGLGFIRPAQVGGAGVDVGVGVRQQVTGDQPLDTYIGVNIGLRLHPDL